MEVFHGARLVRLRCCGRRGMYLSAEEDRRGVCLRSGHRAGANVVWTVRTAVGPDGEAAVLFCSAYGLFLASSDIPATTWPPDTVAALQRALIVAATPPRNMLWQAIWKNDRLLIKNCSGRFLRGNGRAVTVADDNTSSMLHWAVEVLPIQPEEVRILDHQAVEADKEIVEKLLNEEKSELRMILAEISEAEHKREHYRLKMMSLQEKFHRLKYEEQNIKKERQGTVSWTLLRIARETEIANKANLAYAIKMDENRINIEKLQSREVDKRRQIQKLKWRRRQFETTDTSSCSSQNSSP